MRLRVVKFRKVVKQRREQPPPSSGLRVVKFRKVVKRIPLMAKITVCLRVVKFRKVVKPSYRLRVVKLHMVVEGG